MKLPKSLAFVVVTAAACGGDDPPPAVDANNCFYTCVPDQYFDDGGLIGGDAGVECPMCASGPEHDCGPNCVPIGIV